MSLLDILQKKLTPEQLTQVTDALGDDFDYDQVPRTRLNKVIKQRNDLRVELAKAVSAQRDSDDDSDDDDFDDGQMKQTRETAKSKKQKSPTAEELRQQLEQEKNDAIMGVRIQYAGLDKLREIGAVDPEVAFSLLDKTKLTIGNDGKLTGIDEQIEALKTSKSYLFAQQGGRKDTQRGTGKDGGNDEFSGVNSVTEFMKLSSDKQAQFKQAYPTKFSEFLKSTTN